MANQEFLMRMQERLQRGAVDTPDDEGPNPIGFWESFVDDPVKFVPFIGSVAQALGDANIYRAAKRLENGGFEDDFEQMVAKYSGRRAPHADKLEEDMVTVSRYLADLKRKQERGYSFGGNVGRLLGELPSFMIEFAATGGAASAGKAAGKKVVGEVVEGATQKAVRGAVRYGTEAVARTALMPHRISASYQQRKLPVGVSKEGFAWPEGTNATHLAKAIGEVFIENLTETGGGAAIQSGRKAMTKYLKGHFAKINAPSNSKFFGAIYNAYKKVNPTITEDGFMGKIFSRTGWHGVIDEIGEEYAGAALSALVNVEDYGTGSSDPLVRLAAAMAEMTDQTPEMAVAFMVPGAAMGTAQTLALRKQKIEDNAAKIIQRVNETKEQDDETKEIIAGIMQGVVGKRQAEAEVTTAQEAAATEQEAAAAEKAVRDQAKAIQDREQRRRLVQEHVRLYRKWDQTEIGPEKDDLDAEIRNIITLIADIDQQDDPGDWREFKPPEQTHLEGIEAQRRGEAMKREREEAPEKLAERQAAAGQAAQEEIFREQLEKMTTQQREEHDREREWWEKKKQERAEDKTLDKMIAEEEAQAQPEPQAATEAVEPAPVRAAEAPKEKTPQKAAQELDNEAAEVAKIVEEAGFQRGDDAVILTEDQEALVSYGYDRREVQFWKAERVKSLLKHHREIGPQKVEPTKINDRWATWNYTTNEYDYATPEEAAALDAAEAKAKTPKPKGVEPKRGIQSKVEGTLKELGSTAKVIYTDEADFPAALYLEESDTIVINRKIRGDQALREAVIHEVVHKATKGEDIAKLIPAKQLDKYVNIYIQSLMETETGKRKLEEMEMKDFQREAATLIMAEMLAKPSFRATIQKEAASFYARIQAATGRAVEGLAGRGAAYDKLAEKMGAITAEEAVVREAEDTPGQPAPEAEPTTAVGGTITDEVNAKLAEATRLDKSGLPQGLKKGDPFFARAVEFAQRVQAAIERGDTDADAAAGLTAIAMKDIRARALALKKAIPQSEKTVDELVQYITTIYAQVAGGEKVFMPNEELSKDRATNMRSYDKDKGSVSLYLLGKGVMGQQRVGTLARRYAEGTKSAKVLGSKQVAATEEYDPTVMVEDSTLSAAEQAAANEQVGVVNDLVATLKKLRQQEGLDENEIAEIVNQDGRFPVEVTPRMVYDLLNDKGWYMPMADWKKIKVIARFAEIVKNANWRAKPKTEGDPKAANISANEEVRLFHDIIIDGANKLKLKERKSLKQIDAEGEAGFNDPAERATVEELMDNGENLDSARNTTARLITEEAVFKAIKPGATEAEIADGVKRSFEYIHVGTLMGRDLASRRDRYKTRAQRVAEFALGSIMLPNQKARKQLGELYGMLTDPGITEARRQEIADVIDGIYQEAKESYAGLREKFEAELQKAGLSLETLTPEDLNDMDVGIEVIMAAKEATPGRARDWIYELWINYILSGWKTQMANLSGNTLNLGIQKFLVGNLDRLINEGVKFATGRYAHGTKRMSDFSEEAMAHKHLIRQHMESTQSVMMKAFWNTIKRKGRPAFKMDLYDTVPDRAVEDRWSSTYGEIKGPAGKWLRIPTVLLSAVDQVFQAGIAHGAVVNYAYNEAMDEGLTKPEEIQAFMLTQINDAHSVAWQRAMNEALYLTFQEEMGPVAKKYIEFRDKVHDSPVGAIPSPLDLKYTTPFIPTLVNIFKIGAAFVPLNPFVASDIVRTIKSKEYREKGFDQEAKAVHAASKQVIGAAVALAIGSLLDDDNEEGMPHITGSSKFSRRDTGGKAMEYMVAPPTSIRIGNNWYNYGRIEPAAVTAQLIDDGLEMLRAINDGNPIHEEMGKMGAKVFRLTEDKTLLSGLERLFRFAEYIGEENYETALRYTITDFYGSFIMPNLFKQAIRDTADTYLETRVKPQNPLGYIQEMATKAWGRNVPMGKAGMFPKVDALGNDVKRGGPWIVKLGFPTRMTARKDAQVERWLKLAMDWSTSKESEGLPINLGEWPIKDMRMSYKLPDGRVRYYKPDDATTYKMRKDAGKFVFQILRNWKPPKKMNAVNATRLRQLITEARTYTKKYYKGVLAQTLNEKRKQDVKELQ